MTTTNYQHQKNIPQAIFRAYDIRGIVPNELNENTVYTIAAALGSYSKQQGLQQFVVGRDGRLSSPALHAALLTGLLETGCDVVDIGIVPTPLLYYATHKIATSGVMITGSHNPGDYNGLKMVLNRQTLHGNVIQQLYQITQQMDFAKGKGTLQEYSGIIDQYIEDVSQRIQLKRPLRIAIDCGNGVTGIVAPALFKKLGCEVTALYAEVDGHFPNHHPDPSVPDNLQDLIHSVKQQHLDIGLAFDGDGDRLGVVTDLGAMIFPDLQMVLFARDVLQRCPGSNIIFDVKSTVHLARAITEHGGIPVMCKTGHSLIKSKMQEMQAPLAGEMSGHIFFKERWFGFDDALYAGARMLEILANAAQTMTDLFKTIPQSVSTPEIKIAIPELRKFTFMQEFMQKARFPGAELITIDGLRVQFSDGWGLLRLSNTTPCLIARFEADNSAALRRIQQVFKSEIMKVAPELVVGF